MQSVLDSFKSGCQKGFTNFCEYYLQEISYLDLHKYVTINIDCKCWQNSTCSCCSVWCETVQRYWGMNLTEKASYTCLGVWVLVCECSGEGGWWWITWSVWLGTAPGNQSLFTGIAFMWIAWRWGGDTNVYMCMYTVCFRVLFQYLCCNTSEKYEGTKFTLYTLKTSSKLWIW